MSKNEINKKNIIIIGIGAFAIIAIAIIGAISFFTPTSHAQVQKNQFDQVAVNQFNKFQPAQLTEVRERQWPSKRANVKHDTFKAKTFAKFFDAFGNREKNDHSAVTFESFATFGKDHFFAKSTRDNFNVNSRFPRENFS